MGEASGCQVECAIGGEGSTHALEVITGGDEVTEILFDTFTANCYPMPGHQFIVVGIVVVEVQGYTLEAVACDRHAGTVAHGRVVEHHRVVPCRLDQDDINLGVASAHLLDMVVKASVDEGAKDLVPNLRNPPFTDTLTEAIAPVVKGHHGIDTDDQFRACLDRYIKARRTTDTAIGIVTFIDAHGPIEDGDRR